MKYWLGVASAFIVTVALDHFLSRISVVPGIVLADPVTVIAVASTVAAATAVTTGTLNYIASQDAADAARSLKNEQQSALDAQAKAAAGEAAAQAVTGQTFGKDDATTRAISTGLGFGSGNAPVASGRAQLTGMS